MRERNKCTQQNQLIAQSAKVYSAQGKRSQKVKQSPKLRSTQPSAVREKSKKTKVNFSPPQPQIQIGWYRLEANIRSWRSDHLVQVFSKIYSDCFVAGTTCASQRVPF